MAIGSLNGVGFKGVEYPYANGVKENFAPANDKTDTKKKTKVIASAAIAVALAAALGIWAVKRGKKPKAASNLLGELSPDTRKIVEQAKKAETLEYVRKTDKEIAQMAARTSKKAHAKREKDLIYAFRKLPKENAQPKAKVQSKVKKAA